MRSCRPYGNGGGVRFPLLPPCPFVKKDKPFRIYVSYVSGLLAELRFLQLPMAIFSTYSFCTACGSLEQFFRLVCAGNCTFYQLYTWMRSCFQKMYRSHFWLKVQVGLLRTRKPYGHGGGVRFLLLPPHPFVEKKTRPLGLMFLMFLGCLPSSDFTAADGPPGPYAHSAQHVFD